MAGTAVGKFFGEFGLDIDPFIKSVSEIERQSKSIANSIKPLKNVAEDIGKSFTIMGAAATGALGVMIKQAADYGDAMRDASIRTGISASAMSGLKIAAEQSGATFEDLQTGLKKLAVNADAAAKGNKEQEQTFKAMGVAVKDATTGAMRPMADILSDVSERFKKSTNATQEAGQAVALFGKNGTQLIEFLELGKAGLQEFQEKAERLGLSLGHDFPNQADKFKDTLNDLKLAEEGLSVVIGSVLIPALTDYAVGLTNTIVKVRQFIDANRDLVDVLTVLGGGIGIGGAVMLGLSGLLVILPKITEAWKLLTFAIEASPLLALGGVFVAVTAGALLLKNELYGGFVGVGRLAVMTLGALAEGAGTLATAFGADKLGASLKSASVDIQNLADKMLAIRNAILNADTPDTAGQITKMIEAFKLAHKQSGLGDASRETLTRFDKLIGEYASAVGKANSALFGDYLKKQQQFHKDVAEGFSRTSDAAEKYNDALQKNQVATSKLSYTSVDAAAVIAGAIGTTGDAWEEANKKAMGSGHKLFNEIHGLNQTAVDDNVESTKKIYRATQDSVDQSIAAYVRMGNQFAGIFDNMTSNLASAFANMVVHAKFSMDALKQIASNTAESMLAAFMKGLFSPLTKALTEFGAHLGDTISKALGIGGKGAPAAAAAAGVPAGTAGGFGLFGLSGAATLGIGAAIAGGVALATHFIGEGRKAANKFTSGSQGQFDTDLRSTFGEYQRSSAAGTLTLDQATGLQKKLTDLLSGITDDANQFATQGKNQKKVVDQFFAQQQQLFGKDWVNLTSQIDASIATLKSQASTVTGATGGALPLAGIADTGRGVSASSIFANAVDTFKAAVEGLTGGGSGSAGAPIMVTVSSSPQINITVDDTDLAFKVRDEILPEMLKDLQGDVNTVSTKLIQILKPRWNSVPQLGGATV